MAQAKPENRKERMKSKATQATGRVNAALMPTRSPSRAMQVLKAVEQRQPENQQQIDRYAD